MLKFFVFAAASWILASASVAQTSSPSSPTSSRGQLRSEAKGLALGAQTAEAVSQHQLEIASRVLTGKASCELNQHVHVRALSEHPGHFAVDFKNSSYTMVPEETTSGAIRLLDKKAGVVWLQIPSKSMLMNNKLGQRLVDNCKQSSQDIASTR